MDADPPVAADTLREKVIDPGEVVRFASNPDGRGVLFEVRENRKNKNVVISLD